MLARLIASMAVCVGLAGCATDGVFEGGAPEPAFGAELPPVSDDPDKAAAQFAAGLIGFCAVHALKHSDFSDFDEPTIQSAYVGNGGRDMRAYAFIQKGRGVVAVFYVEPDNCLAVARSQEVATAFETLAALLKPLGGVPGDRVLPSGERGGLLRGDGGRPYLWVTKPISLEAGALFGGGGKGVSVALIRSPDQ